MTRVANADHDALVARVRDALATGRISAAQVEALLDRSTSDARPAALQVLVGIGSVVAYLGVVLAYAVGFSDYPQWVQVATPFVFPMVALATAGWLQRANRAYWMRESVALIAFASLVGATLASVFAVSDAPDGVWFGWIGAAWALVALVSGRWMRGLRVPWLAVAGAVIVSANGFGSWIFGDDDLYRWLELGLAVALAAGATVAGRRRQPLAAEGLLAGAIASSYAAAVLGVGDVDITEAGLSPWHVLLTIAVAAALVLAPALEMPVLYVVGAFGALLWLGFVIPIATQSAAWALLIVVVGIALIGVAAAGSRLRGRRDA
ncbi:MAG: hypothetical protein KDC46_12460 [Thermoleophilia bacterium]|nr:hypothetical protein [Thermoleophilia bacterium]